MDDIEKTSETTAGLAAALFTQTAACGADVTAPAAGSSAAFTATCIVGLRH
jgi:hypothetical protein